MPQTGVGAQNGIRQFSHALKVKIAAPPEKVWNAIVEGIDHWWTKRYTENPGGMRFEAFPGGRFWENFDDKGNGFVAAIVTWVEKPKRLEYRGHMGMRGAVAGVINMELEESNGDTILKVTYDAIGEISDEVMDGYRKGWSELCEQNLKNFVEKGLRVR